MNRALISLGIIASLMLCSAWRASDLNRWASVRRQAESGATVPTDYQHYWHPSKYDDGMDYGNAITPLHAPNVTGSITLDENGWTFPSSGLNYIKLADDINNGTAYTIAFWARNAGGGAVGGWVLCDRNGATGSDDFQFVYAENYWVCESWKSDNSFVRVVTSVPTTNWHHVAYSVAANQTLYINGAPVATNAFGTAKNTATAVAVIGNGSWGCCGLKNYRGGLDKLQLWTRELAASEIAALAAQARTE
jgi:hypothetical protein